MVPVLHYLPAIYQSFFPDFFQASIPEEKLATCEDCAMCNKGKGLANSNDLFFSEETKCCTYFPPVPNYLVGGILTSSDPGMQNGKKYLTDMIAKGTNIYPTGIFPSQEYRNNFKKNKELNFGRANSLLCPFFNTEARNCNIWQFRPNVCSTWFCKNVKGKDGEDFWNSVRHYLTGVEQNLTRYTLHELGYENKSITGLMQNNTYDHKGKGTNYKKRWLHWYGREEDFFLSAFSLVKQLSRRSFQEIMEDQDPFLKRLSKARETMLSPSLPLVLKRNPELSVFCQEGKYQLVNETCNVVLSKKLYDILNFFDGIKDTESINKLLRKEHSCFLNDKLLIKLYQNRILI